MDEFKPGDLLKHITYLPGSLFLIISKDSLRYYYIVIEPSTNNIWPASLEAFGINFEKIN